MREFLKNVMVNFRKSFIYVHVSTWGQNFTSDKKTVGLLSNKYGLEGCKVRFFSSKLRVLEEKIAHWEKITSIDADLIFVKRASDDN